MTTYTQKAQREQAALLSLCAAAKEGDEQAIQELEAVKLRVWTQKELDALNYFLKNKESYHKAISKGEKSWLEQEVGFAQETFSLLWSTPLETPYFVACTLNGNAQPHYWVAYSNHGRLCLAFDTGRWLTYEM